MTRARLYSFDLQNQTFVLRFLDPKHAKKQRANEIQASKIAHHLGIAPPCVSSDKNSLLMIMPFICGHTLSSKDLENPHKIALLGKMLASLHGFSREYPKRYTFHERLQIHYQKGIENKIAYPTGFDISMKNALKDSVNESLLVPCHGDLNPSNVLIVNEEIFIIDWTNATLDVPFMDLSYLSMLSGMSAQQERVFLQAYLGRKPTFAELDRLRNGQSKVCLLTATIWFLFSEEENDQNIPFDERIARLDAQLHSPFLKNAEEYLQEGKVIHLQSDSKEAIRDYALSFYKEFLRRRVPDSILK